MANKILTPFSGNIIVDTRVKPDWEIQMMKYAFYLERNVIEFNINKKKMISNILSITD